VDDATSGALGLANRTEMQIKVAPSAFPSFPWRSAVPTESGAGLEAGFPHESFPLGTVGVVVSAVSLEGDEVGELVAECFL
jgi:hypothetical protein